MRQQGEYEIVPLAVPSQSWQIFDVHQTGQVVPCQDTPYLAGTLAPCQERRDDSTPGGAAQQEAPGLIEVDLAGGRIVITLPLYEEQ